MLEREHTLRFTDSSRWKELLTRGLGLPFSNAARISGLGVKVPALKSGEAHIAGEIAKGIFRFAGTSVLEKPVDIFNVQPPTMQWHASLHDLSWLKHFIASGNELHRIVACTLLLKWDRSNKNGRTRAIDAEALISLSAATEFLIGNSNSYLDSLCTIVEKLARRVSSQLESNPADRLKQIMALQHASLAFRFSGAMRDDANAKFCEVINKVVLADGGHISRDPLQLLDTLLTLIPIKDAMMHGHQAVPQLLTAAIERMVPMLRMICHADQNLGHFQGAGAVRTDWINAILERDKVHGRPLMLAPHSGFCRLAHGSGLLIVDVGARARCDGALALEFSDGLHRIFTNCGMPNQASTAWKSAAACIAAHNTLEIKGGSKANGRTPRAEVVTSPKGSLVNCQDEKTTRITHERNLFLSHDGRDLRGQDQLISSKEAPNFTLRFHLHPAVKASSIRNGSKIVIMLPNRAAWQFSTRGGSVALEESVFLGDEAGPRKTMQIVIRAAGPVKWALKKLDKPASNGGEAEEAPRLPF
jgi:uncharacterized heparinase superfamily protein